MRKTKRRRPQNLPTAKKVLLLCEGDSEYAFFDYELKDYRKNITLLNVGGGGYVKIKEKLMEKESLYRVFLVVCDLDRAYKNPAEMHHLGEVINWLKSNSKENNIFLTYENFECWIAAWVGLDIREDYSESLANMGYRKGEHIKALLRLPQCSIDAAKEAFKSVPSDDYFFRKEGLEWGASHIKQNAGNRQSNLLYFFDYLKLLASSSD